MKPSSRKSGGKSEEDSNSVQQINLDSTPNKSSLKMSDSPRKVESNSKSKSNSGKNGGSDEVISSSGSNSTIKRLLRYRRLHTYYPFVADTIKEDALQELTGITINVFFLIRLIILSLFLVVFQNTPLIQVLVLSFIKPNHFIQKKKIILLYFISNI